MNWIVRRKQAGTYQMECWRQEDENKDFDKQK